MTRMAGLVVADRFKLRRLIGSGGTGQVWETTDLRTKSLVALKILRDDVSEDVITQARFRREADTIASLDHPGIARFVDYGHVPFPSPLGGRTVTYLATEFIRGESLSALIHRSERLPPGRTLAVLEGIARALGHAHAAGVVHRDVKPSNILVTRDGAAKLTDFGIVRVLGEATLTHVGTVMGTARYMSPEQARGDVATAASDVYSLAVVGYEMITGTALFAGQDPLSIAMSHMEDEPARLPDAAGKPLQALIARALQKDPGRRPANGTEFAEEIAAARRPIGPPAPSTGGGETAATRMLRRLKGLRRN